MEADASPGGVRLVHVFVAAFALVMLGCDGDECEAGQARCRDNVAEYCDMEYSDGSAPMVWIGEDCGEGVCKAGLDETPFCALADSPDPRCGDDSDSAVCDEELQVSCRHGYATAITDCAAEAGHCVQPEAGAICAVESEPNELCTDDSYTACEGNALLDCQHGYVISRDDCAAREGFCVVTPGYAMCNAAADPDPLCPLESASMYVCDGTVVVDCAYGYRINEESCLEGTVCQHPDGDVTRDAFCGKG